MLVQYADMVVNWTWLTCSLIFWRTLQLSCVQVVHQMCQSAKNYVYWRGVFRLRQWWPVTSACVVTNMILLLGSRFILEEECSYLSESKKWNLARCFDYLLGVLITDDGITVITLLYFQPWPRLRDPHYHSYSPMTLTPLVNDQDP